MIASRAALQDLASILVSLYARDLEQIERMARLVTATLRRKRTVFFCGNGGSAAEAQHLATELTVRYVRDREALPAVALSADGAVLTAAGNDLGFDRVFARQIEALGRRGDLLVAMTTSGRSRNVIEACRAARARGMGIIGLTGAGGVAFARRCDLALRVPSRDTARIQEIHLLVGHILCARAEETARGIRTRRDR
ncbi:MAG: SIS domain-containing protein, partial [Candidatus Latescibacteria bacterium]|nr:SIS domain-containing protein [Candidatus Latescibacterota bacterium]